MITVPCRAWPAHPIGGSFATRICPAASTAVSQMNLKELALLKLLHFHLSPNASSMEYYSRIFHALCWIENANLKDLQRLTELDCQSISYLLEKMRQTTLLEENENEYCLICTPEKLLRKIDQTEKNSAVATETIPCPKTRPRPTKETKSWYRPRL